MIMADIIARITICCYISPEAFIESFLTRQGRDLLEYKVFLDPLRIPNSFFSLSLLSAPYSAVYELNLFLLSISVLFPHTWDGIPRSKH